MSRIISFALVSSAAVLLSTAAIAAPTRFIPYPLPAGTTVMDPTFTRDGNTLYAVRVIDKTDYGIVVSTRQGTTWSTPTPVSFSGHWRDLEEALSPDGNTMVFVSNRPAKSGGAALDGAYYHHVARGGGGNLWIAHRTPSGWSEPVRLPDAINANSSTFSPTIGPDGTIYFMRAYGPRAAFTLFMSTPENGVYRRSRLAPFSDPGHDDFDPTIDPSGSFIVFTSTRPPMPKKKSALFISFNHNGRWTAPRILGDDAHPIMNAVEARLSPDLKTLYYSSHGGVWETPLPILGVRQGR